jgi:hypothetical protein
MKIDTTIHEALTVDGHPYRVFMPFGNFETYHEWLNKYMATPEIMLVISWCVNAFGRWCEIYEPNPPHRWYFQNGAMWFRDDADVELFLLRWA